MLNSLLLGVSKFTYISGKPVCEDYKAPLNTDFKIIDVNLPQLIKNGANTHVKVDKKIQNINVDDFVNNYNVCVKTGVGSVLNGFKFISHMEVTIRIVYPDEISIIFPLDYLYNQSYLDIWFKKIDGTDMKKTETYLIHPGFMFSIY